MFLLLRKLPKLPKKAHTLTAEVLEFIYMGDTFRTRLKVAGNEDFIVKTRNSSNQVRLKPGEKVEIGWSPETSFNEMVKRMVWHDIDKSCQNKNMTLT